MAVFRDTTRYTSSVHHAKYFYVWLHPSRNIAGDVGKTNEIYILLVCINFYYLVLFIQLFYNALRPLRFILPLYIVYIHCPTSRKVAGLIPDGVTGFFHWHNPSGRTMALALTHPLTEMNTRNVSWG